jgi:acid stress-induced BolA-like protein IbaG/YrbA
MNEEQIKQMIEAGIPGAQVRIGGDGRHFEAAIVSPEFTGKSMVQQHQMVYKALGDSFQTDAIHALSFKTYTPEEWAEAGGS